MTFQLVFRDKLWVRIHTYYTNLTAIANNFVPDSEWLLCTDEYGWDDPNCQVFNGFWPACQIRHLEPPHCPGCFSLAWCGCPGGEDGRRQPAPTITIITGQMRLTIHHSGWWFQNVLRRFVTFCVHVYPNISNGWLEHTGAQFLQLRQIFRGSTTDQLEWGFEANSAVHEHVKQCEMLRSFPAKWLLSIWIAAPPVGNMESPHSWKSWKKTFRSTMRSVETSPTLGSLRWWGRVQSKLSLSSIHLAWAWHGWRLWWSRKIVDQPI